MGPVGQEVLVTYQEIKREPGPRCNCPEETFADYAYPEARDMPEYHAEGCPWGEFWLERK